MKLFVMDIYIYLTLICDYNKSAQIVMSNLREESTTQDMYEQYEYDQGIDEPMRGMYDSDYDMWEEWMGWEGAGIRDYSSHINPYL